MRKAIFPFLAIVAGCSSPPTAPTPPGESSVVIVSGKDQTQLAGYLLDDEIVVEITDDKGDPIKDLQINLSTTGPGAVLSEAALTTDDDGRASFAWRLGVELGEQVVQGVVDAPDGGLNFTVKAQAVGSAVRSISGSIYGMCAVYLDGRLGCFKPNRERPHVPPAVVPDNSGRLFREVAVQLSIPGSDTWPLDGCAIDDAGKVWCFKLDYSTMKTSAWRSLDGSYPTLGSIGGGVSYSAPTRSTYCALDEEGGLWCWGADAAVMPNGSTLNPTLPGKIDLPFPVATFAIGVNFACAAATDGATWCWGRNGGGQLGRTGVSNDIQPPAPMEGDQRFSQLIPGGGYQGACGLWQGQVKCWGEAIPYDLAQGMPIDRRHVPVLTTTGVLAIADGGEESKFGIAIKAGGTATAWGTYPGQHASPSTGKVHDAKYRVPLTELIQNTMSDVFCGRNGSGQSVLCFHALMFTWYGLIDPTYYLVGFGVPPLD